MHSYRIDDSRWQNMLEPESEQREAQTNLSEVIKDPNQSSEEPKASTA
jgi:hypothetical protein